MGVVVPRVAIGAACCLACARLGGSSHPPPKLATIEAHDLDGDGVLDRLIVRPGDSIEIASSRLGTSIQIIGEPASDFGRSIAIVGPGFADPFGNAARDLLIGAPLASAGGRAYVFHGPLDGRRGLLTKVKSVQYINDFRFAHPLGQRLHHLDFHNHHTVPKEWATVLYENTHGPGAVPPGGWDAWLNNMPGVLMHRSEHVGGTSSFHRILGERLPAGTTDPMDIVSGLQETYAAWDSDLGPKVWAVASKWLRAPNTMKP
jgi:hypothetical protein